MSTKNKRQENFFGTCGKCETSYACCHETRPPITARRKRIIEDYLRDNGISLANPFVKEDYVFPREDPQGFCVFHDTKSRMCKVHAVKPETCVSGPITFDINLRNGKIEWFVKKEEICRLARVVYEDDDLLRKHLTAAKREILRLVEELEPDALRAILKKDEPATFKIGEDPADGKILDKLRS